jgi:hypothetical protein
VVAQGAPPQAGPDQAFTVEYSFPSGSKRLHITRQKLPLGLPPDHPVQEFDSGDDWNPTKKRSSSSSARCGYLQEGEQRGFEILAAHWDLPVTDITPR